MEALEIQAWREVLGLSESQARNLIQVRKEEEKRAERNMRWKLLDELEQRKNKLMMLYQMPARLSPKMRVIEIEIEKRKIKELYQRIKALPTLELQL